MHVFKPLTNGLKALIHTMENSGTFFVPFRKFHDQAEFKKHPSADVIPEKP